MDSQEEKKKLSRKGFLQLCGSVAAGAVIAGGTGSLLWKMFAKPDDVFYNTNARMHRKPIAVISSHLIARCCHSRQAMR